MRSIVVVIAVLAGGCDKKSGAQAEGTSAPAAVEGPNEDCSPPEQQRRWDLLMDASERYLKALEGVRDSWSSCEAATKALTLIAPEAARYESQMKELMVWLRARGKECADAVQAKFAEDTRLADLEARGDRLEADIKPRAAECNDQPGFREAFDASMKLMKKK